MWPPHEVSNFAYNFEASFDSRIAKRFDVSNVFDILTPSFTVLYICIISFMNTNKANANLYKKFCIKIKNRNGEQKSFGRNY